MNKKLIAGIVIAAAVVCCGGGYVAMQNEKSETGKCADIGNA